MLFFSLILLLLLLLLLLTGFIFSALKDDANRAIEIKNGSSVGGRKIAVKHAMHRASLEQRRAKAAQGQGQVQGQYHPLLVLDT